MRSFIYWSVVDAVTNENCTLWEERRGRFIKLLDELNPKPSTKDNANVSFNYLDKKLNKTGKPRVRTLISRFLTRKLELNNGFLDDVTIRIMSDKICKRFCVIPEVKICKGKEITQNYEEEVGGHSCMTGDMAHCTKLYEMNPTRFEQVVVIFRNDSARAILSTLDNGEKYCDRVYCTSNFVKDYLYEYAEERGWFKAKLKDRIISNLDFKDGCVPYMDTFFCFNVDKNKLTIFSDRGLEHHGLCDSTDGQILDEVYVCYNCDERVENCSYIHGEHYCNSCAEDIFIVCDECNNYEWGSDALSIRGDWYCKSCFDRIGTNCDSCGESEYSDKVTEVHQDNVHIISVCNDCTNIYSKCEVCEEWYKTLKDNRCEECYEGEIEYSEEWVL